MAEGGDFSSRAVAVPSVACKRDVFYENVRKELSEKDVKDILLRMLTTLQTNEEYCRRLDEAKIVTGTNMAKFMILAYPIVAESQIKILEELKVGKGTKGLAEFCAEANKLSHENEEVNHLFSEIRSIFLPPLKNKHLIKPEYYNNMTDDCDPARFSSLDLNS